MATNDHTIVESSLGSALAEREAWREFGRMIWYARLAARISRAGLAELADLSVSTVLDIEIGMLREENTDPGPTIREISAIATALSVDSVNWLTRAREIREGCFTLRGMETKHE